jgi:hypothetical protein
VDDKVVFEVVADVVGADADVVFNVVFEVVARVVFEVVFEVVALAAAEGFCMSRGAIKRCLCVWSPLLPLK